MKKVIYAVFIIFLLVGCVSYQGIYNLGLQEVERPEDAKERYGDSKIVNFEEEGKTKYSYEDDMIKIVWLPLTKQFAFTVQNKTDHSIKIIWDEAVYVDENGSSCRVMHSGVKYTERSNPQPPTVIVKKANISDIILPTDNVYYVRGQGWNTRPLFRNWANTPEELDTLTKKFIGKTVQILLPLQIEETINEYIFSFKVEDFVPR